MPGEYYPLSGESAEFFKGIARNVKHPEACCVSCDDVLNLKEEEIEKVKSIMTMIDPKLQLQCQCDKAVCRDISRFAMNAIHFINVIDKFGIDIFADKNIMEVGSGRLCVFGILIKKAFEGRDDGPQTYIAIDPTFTCGNKEFLYKKYGIYAHPHGVQNLCGEELVADLVIANNPFFYREEKKEYGDKVRNKYGVDVCQILKDAGLLSPGAQFISAKCMALKNFRGAESAEKVFEKDKRHIVEWGMPRELTHTSSEPAVGDNAAGASAGPVPDGS